MDIFFQVLEYRACVIHYLLTRPTALTGSWSWKIRNLRKAATAHFTHLTLHISLYTSPHITLHISLYTSHFTHLLTSLYTSLCACQQGLFHQVLSHVLLGVQILIFCIKCKLSHKCFSLLKYTYYNNYRSHISLQVVKLAKSAGVQILIFPTVFCMKHPLTSSLSLLPLTHMNQHIEGK